MSEDLLVVSGLTVSYGGVTAVHALDVTVPRGAIVAVVGPNGAGKTSAIRGIAGQATARGTVVLAGREISRCKPYQIARLGLAQVPQGRRLFPGLTVLENLLLGAYGRPQPGDLDQVFALFPVLADRRAQAAGSLSGGEQQMVAIGRALMNNPVLVAMDEPSFGLAPIVVAEVFDRISHIRSLGVSVLLVEQNATQALAVADRVCVLERGRVVFAGDAGHARQNVDLIDAYVG